MLDLISFPLILSTPEHPIKRPLFKISLYVICMICYDIKMQVDQAEK